MSLADADHVEAPPSGARRRKKTKKAKKAKKSKAKRKLSTTAAAADLGISVGQFERIVAARGIEPDDTCTNSHYRSGPPVKLWSARTLARLRRTKDLESAKSRRRGPMEKIDPSIAIAEQYGSPEEAIHDAADALFKLNRYTRHMGRGSLLLDETRELKAQFVTHLYMMERYTDRVEALKRKLPAQECFECEGTGSHEYEDEEHPCERCDGTGDYRKAREVTSYSFRFTIDGESFCWIEPDFAIKFVPKVEETRPDEGPSRQRGEPGEPMSKQDIVEAKALVRYALLARVGDPGMVEQDPDA